MNSIIKVQGKDRRDSKDNSDRKQISINDTEKSKHLLHFKHKLWLNVKNYFGLLFAIFSIIIPVGIQPQLQTTEAFDQSVINDNINGMREDSNGNGKSNNGVIEFKGPTSIDLNYSSVSNSQIGTQSTTANNKSAPSDQLKEELSFQASTQPTYRSYRDYVDRNKANASKDSAMLTNDKPSDLNSTDSQMGTIHSSINDNANEKVNEVVIVPEDQSTTIQPNYTTTSQSQSSSQSSHKSFSGYLDHSNENKIDTNNSAITSDDQSSVESSSTGTTSSQLNAQSSGEIYGDFNDDGFDDVAIGIPQENVGSIDNAGAVAVIYGSSSGLSATSARADQFWTQDSADVEDASETDDEFGSSLTSGDFNDDGIDDLAIGVPGEDIGSATDAGAVNVIYGSGAGLHALLSQSNQFWTQSTTDVNDASETFDEFGSSLASGDFNGDGRDDLAIGVPGENEGGAVNVLYGSSSGLSATSPRPDQFWSQSTTDVNDATEIGDSFGHSLTSGDFNNDGKDDLAIGVPDEGLEGAGLTGSVGAVEVIYGSSSGLSATSPRSDQFWTQNSPNIDDVAENSNAFGWSLTSGDFNDDGKDDLAIGIRWEQISSKSEVGAVEVIYGSSSGLSATSARTDQFWTQDSANINDATESEDQFGYSLSSGDYNGDDKDDLAIGVWDEDVDIGGGTDVDEAGGVEVIYGSSSGLSATSPRSDQFWTQDSPDVNDVPERPDEFGSSLTSGDFNSDGRDDLAIGVPQEDVGSIDNAGAVAVIYGSSSGLSATSPRSDQFWTQDSADMNDASETGDEFGTALG